MAFPLPIRLVIFDCDGVLFDSEPANLAFYREVLRRAEVPTMPESHDAAYHSLASAQLFQKMFAHDPALLQRVQRVAKVIDYSEFFPLMVPKPRLRETLTKLKSRHSIAMATNRGQTTQGVVDYFGLREFFGLAVGVHDVVHPKPAPDMLVKCLDHFGVEPREAVYVGDQPTDLEAAVAAGIRFIGMGPVCGMANLSVQRFEDIATVVAGLST